jgi:hypothetical protein
MAVLAGADNVYAQTERSRPADKSLYERLGGVFAIAAVVVHFSDAVVKNPIVGQKSKNPQLREWHTKQLGRLPGLKFMRTLWVCDVSSGPFQFKPNKPGTTPLGLEEAHRNSRFPPQNSMRLPQNSDGPWTSSKSRSARRAKSWQPSPSTKRGHSRLRCEAPLKLAMLFSLDVSARQSWAGNCWPSAVNR